MQFEFFLFQGPEHKNVCLWASGFLEPRFVICFTQSSWSWWSSSAKAKSCSIIIEIILIIYLLSIVPNEQNEYRFSFFIDICMASSKFERSITFMAKRLFESLKICIPLLLSFWSSSDQTDYFTRCIYLPCWANWKFDHLIICRATWGQKRGEEKSKSGPGKHWSQVHISGSYSIAM